MRPLLSEQKLNCEASPLVLVILIVIELRSPIMSKKKRSRDLSAVAEIVLVLRIVIVIEFR